MIYLLDYFYPSYYVVFAHTLSYINWELLCFMVKLKIIVISIVFFTFGLVGLNNSETSLSADHSKELRENKKECIFKKENWLNFN